MGTTIGQETEIVQRYSWYDFTKDKNHSYCDRARDFFEELYQSWEKDTQAVFVFVSRRAFCLYLLMKKKGVLRDEWEKIDIYSDRYVMKNMDPDIFLGRTVFFVDDCLITGKHMEKGIDMLRKYLNNPTIQPRVFAVEERWRGKKWEYASCKVMENENRFYTHNDILRLCAIESLLFYYNDIPYTMELPLIAEGNGESLAIELTEAEFQLLTQKNSKWEYYNCGQLGYMQNDLTSGLFVLNNNILKMRFGYLIHDLAVRLQFYKENGKIKMICIPFAILKSVKFDWLYELFQNLFIGTEYRREVDAYVDKNNKEGKKYKDILYIAIYRAIVFILSMYVGQEFQEYLKSLYKDRRFSFYTKFYSFHFEDTFCKSITKMTQKGLAMYLLNVLVKERGRNEEVIVPALNRFWFEEYHVRRYDYKVSCNFMLEIINDLRHGGAKKIIRFGNDFITIEEIVQAFRNYLFIADDELEDPYVSRCICNMLNHGILVNVLNYDKDTEWIYRGFSYGENSDAFFEISAKVFYAAVWEYYKMTGENYRKSYDRFVVSLFRFFKENKLFDTFITVDDFNFYEKYFRMAGEGNFTYQITNKEFLLDEPETPYYIGQVKKYIEKLNFE